MSFAAVPWVQLPKCLCSLPARQPPRSHCSGARDCLCLCLASHSHTRTRLFFVGLRITPQDEIIPTCRELGIAILAYSPLSELQAASGVPQSTTLWPFRNVLMPGQQWGPEPPRLHILPSLITELTGDGANNPPHHHHHHLTNTHTCSFRPRAADGRGAQCGANPRGRLQVGAVVGRVGLGCRYNPQVNQTQCKRLRRRAWPRRGWG